jgi:periplasmic divalent cation tolerance protein
MTDKIVVLVTTKGVTEAKKIARALVEEKLAACANVITSVRSIYRWEGKVTEERECLMIIKSTRGRFDELRTAVERLHSYSVPEVIALPMVDGAPNYLNWIADSTGATSTGEPE